jgi:hypothetical protein
MLGLGLSLTTRAVLRPAAAGAIPTNAIRDRADVAIRDRADTIIETRA